MWVYQEHLKHKNSLSYTRNNHREDNKNFMSYFTIKTSRLTMPFTIKHNKRIKFKGVWKHYDSRHLIGPPHTWEKHCPQWFKKEKENRRRWWRMRKKGMRKAHNFQNGEKKWTWKPLSNWHGRATISTGRANLLASWMLFAWLKARACHHRHGPCQPSGVWGAKFVFLFTNQSWTITYKIRNKQKRKSD